jgi:WhiB family transcriptional regulator, redox-sensing transcriptional regulator
MNDDPKIRVYAEGRTNARREPWQDDALCAQTSPDLFTVDKGESSTEAKKICAACPVVRQCLEYALRNDIRHSVWGGKTPNQRRLIVKEKAA